MWDLIVLISDHCHSILFVHKTVFISQLIRFDRVCSDVDDFNARNKVLTVKISQTRK